MPGTYAHDASAPSLTGGFASPLVATTTSSIVTVGKPKTARVRLSTGTVTGTSPTLDVEIQGSNDPAFNTGNSPTVSLGRFSQLNGGSQSNVTRYLEVEASTMYMRAVATLGGTSPSYGSLVIDVNHPHYLETDTDSA